MNHPEYHRPRKYHDIAVIFLSEAVKFTPFVRPACLSTLTDFSNNQAIATGFGKTAHGERYYLVDSGYSGLMIKFQVKAGCIHFISFMFCFWLR